MKRTGVLVILALTFVIGAVWYVAVFQPIDTARATALRRGAAARLEYQALSARLARLERLEADRANQEALARRLEAAVPKNPDLGVFILEANTIANNAGISWIAVTPASSTTQIAEGFTAIPVQIKVEGGFFSILDYITRVEQAKRLVIIDSVTIAPLPPDRTGGRVDPVNPQLGAVLYVRIFTRADAFTSSGAVVTTTTTAAPPTTTTTAKKVGP